MTPAWRGLLTALWVGALGGGLVGAALGGRTGATALAGVGAIAAAALEATRRGRSQRALRRALRALELHPDAGAVALQQLALHPWTLRAHREHAALSAGFYALERGDFTAARRWLGRATGPRAAEAAAARALAAALEGDFRAARAESEAALRRGGPALQREVDAVRVYQLWAEEGAAVAGEVAARLLTPESHWLHRALYALSLEAEGDPARAAEVFPPAARAALARTHWIARIPALADLTRSEQSSLSLDSIS